MKFLLETVFNLLIFGIIIMNLPTIIGFVSLCIIIKVVYSIVSDSFSDNEGTHTNKQTGITEKHNIKCEYQQKREEQKAEQLKSKSSDTYSGHHYTRPRYSNDDGYDNSYDSYYDGWQDDMPPEEGDGFRGTGAPFL